MMAGFSVALVFMAARSRHVINSMTGKNPYALINYGEDTACFHGIFMSEGVFLEMK